MAPQTVIDCPAQSPHTGVGANNVARDVAILVAGSMLAAVFGALIVFVVPRVTGVDDFGYWRLFLLYVTYVGFFHMGFGEGALLSWAGRSLDEFHQDIRSALKFQTGQHLAILIPGCLMAAILLPPKARFVALSVLAFALLQNTTTLLQLALQAARQFRPLAVATAAPGGLFLIFVALILFRGKPDHRILICCYFLAWLFTLGFLWRRVCPLKTYGSSSAWAIGKRYLLIGWPITLANTAFSLVQTSDRFVLSSAVSIYDFAQYSLAASTMMVPLAIIAAASRVFFPHLAATEKEQHPTMYGQAARFILLTWTVLLPYYFAVDAVVHYFLRAYVPSLSVAKVLLLGVLFVAAIQILQSSVFNLYGRQKHYLLYTLIAVVGSMGLAGLAVLFFHSLLLVATMQVVSVGAMWLFLAWKLRSLTGESWLDLLRMLIVFGWSSLSLWLAFSWGSNLAVRTLCYLLLAAGPLTLTCANEMRLAGRLIWNVHLFLSSSLLPDGSSARE
jgi:O-antigen/teichoic acid export membrane protein